MDLEKAIEKLENAYRAMLNGDFTPEEEARARVQMLSFLSTIRAAALASSGNTAKSLAKKTENVKNLLIAFDPYGPWFREVNELVDEVYDLIATAKTIKLEETVQKPPANLDIKLSELSQNLEKLSSTVSSEISKLRNELDSLRTLVSQVAEAIPQSLIPSGKESLHQSPERISVQSILESSEKPPVEEVTSEEEQADDSEDLILASKQQIAVSEEVTGEGDFRELVELERKRYLLEKNLENLKSSAERGSIPGVEYKNISEEIEQQLNEVLTAIEKIQRRLKDTE
ncbi:MAG: hypothetical protein ACFE7E_01975 [Candidatus Hodarchaeota archaeon]